MKLNLIKIFSILAFALIVISCGKEKSITSETNEVQTSTDGVVYYVDRVNSRVEWKGYKVFKTDQTTHFGVLQFLNGKVTAKNGKLQSGDFTIDVNSLKNIDLSDDEEMKLKLESHLKSADFFEVEKFPTATYEITKIADAKDGDYNTIIDGNLTIKGITKSVQFKANVTVDGENISIASEPTDINREDFGLNFEIPLENGLLNKEVNLQILVKAMENK